MRRTHFLTNLFGEREKKRKEVAKEKIKNKKKSE